MHALRLALGKAILGPWGAAVRMAWLRHEGYFDVQFRSGWRVRPFDFDHFDDLHDLRIVLETAAVERLAFRTSGPALAEAALWQVY